MLIQHSSAWRRGQPMRSCACTAFTALIAQVPSKYASMTHGDNDDHL
jgi:hypothetical protein